MEFDELYKKAAPLAKTRQLSRHTEAANVGAAILSAAGNVYLGVNIDTACSMGFCAEHAAIAAMVTAGESEIAKVIAVNAKGEIIPPCGRCRQFMSQLNNNNANALVQINSTTILTLSQLLPFDWTKAYDE